MSQPSKAAGVWEVFHDHPTFRKFLKIHNAESPKRTDETKDQYRLRVAQKFHDVILQPFQDEANRNAERVKFLIYFSPKETIVLNRDKHKDLIQWYTLMNIDFNTNCPGCGIIYGRGDKIESKDSQLKRYNLYMKNRAIPLTDEIKSRIAESQSITSDEWLQWTARRLEGWYQICTVCSLSKTTPSILSKRDVGVPSDVPTTPPQAVYGVPPDVANIESVDLIKFLLMCLKPGSVLSIRQIHEILNIYAKITIERALYRSEKEEVYQARGLKEHLMKTGWPRMYCLKPDSYAAFRQQYDIRQIRKIVDRFIGPSRYKNEFIELE